MAREDNIVPTIRGGDIVRVKFRAGGNLMNAGDVMVFFNVVARDPLPEAM